MDARRLALLALAALLVAPLVAADDGSDPTQAPQTRMCRSASIDAPSNQPVTNWIIIDPDGCFTNMTHRVVDYVVGYIPWL